MPLYIEHVAQRFDIVPLAAGGQEGMSYVLPPGVVCTVATHDPAYGNLDSN
jgi:hypothetical protein